MTLMNQDQFGGVNDSYSTNGGGATLQMPEQQQQAAGGSPYGAYGMDAAIGRGTAKAYGKFTGGGAAEVSPEAGVASFEHSAATSTLYPGAEAGGEAATTGMVGAGAAGSLALGAGAGLAVGLGAKALGADDRVSEGAGIGAGIGTAIAPGVGTAVGGAVGAAGGWLSEQFK